MNRTRTRPRRGPLRLLASLPVALLVLLPTAAHAAVPVAPVRLPTAIEGFATYQPQTKCSPTAKPGAVKLKNLLLRTYPGTRSLGISRACSAGGASEHKEGRAFDWGVRYANPAERAKATAFLNWLLKADSRGRKAANARRLGVMYVIWNHRIWGAYAANQGWRPYHGSNPHTDHVHISLTRAGGAGSVSFWTGRVNGTGTTATTGTADSAGNVHPPAGVPAPTPIVPAPVPPSTLPAGPELEDETVRVAPTRSGAYTSAALVAGETYRVEVRGTWTWDRTRGSVADGECSYVPGTDWWHDRWLANAAGDQLGLYLDGRDLALQTYSGGGCASSSHTYVTEVRPSRTGRVPLRVWEPAPAAAYADNAGALTVRVIHEVDRDQLPVQLDTHERWGTTTPGSLEAGEQYTVTATGTWSFRGATADAVCTGTDQGPAVLRDDSGRRLWRLTVDGQSMRAVTCTPDHRYSWTITAQHDGPAVVRIDTDSYDASSGQLSVVLSRA